MTTAAVATLLALLAMAGIGALARRGADRAGDDKAIAHEDWWRPGRRWLLVPIIGIVASGCLIAAAAWPGCRLRGDVAYIVLAGILGVPCWLMLTANLVRASRRGTTPWKLAAKVIVGGLAVAFVWAFMIGNMGATDRGFQKRSMSDMRTLATAMEVYSLENQRYPIVDGTAADLVPLLPPGKPQPLPIRDGWGADFHVRSSATEYTIVSYGLCCQPDPPGTFVAPNGGTTSWGNDIVFATGSFVKFPDGTQQGP